MGDSRLIVLGFALTCGFGCAASNAEQADAAAVNVPTPDSGAPRASEVYLFPCLEDVPARGEHDFDSVYREVFCPAGCTNQYCHGSGTSSSELTFETVETAYAALISVPPWDMGPCSGQDVRVQPGQPDKSLLFQKLTGSATCGGPMPPPTPGNQGLSRAQIQRVRDWIEQGAVLYP